MIGIKTYPPIDLRISSDTLQREEIWKINHWHGQGHLTKDLTDDDIFSLEARKDAGKQLRKVQRGDEPDDWKPFEDIGAGTKEIRIKLPDGAFRVMHVAKFPEAVYVLHCFKKKTQKTSPQDKDIAKQRYKAIIQERSKS